MNILARIGIPPDQDQPLLQRLAIVWTMALGYALCQWTLTLRDCPQAYKVSRLFAVRFRAM